MNSTSSSPKRRHILSSINPDRSPRRTRKEEAEPASFHDNPRASLGQDRDDKDDADTTKPRRTRLKLKGEKRRHRSRDGRDRDCSHRRHHRRRHRSPTPPNPHDPPPLDPDAAFRESLFDAMADDEGAAYWEGVYGQPLHVYSADKVGPTGELERMTEEEYVTYVQRKMWEKTNAGLLEERERRQAERERAQKEERDHRRRQREMERTSRQEEEHRRRQRWDDRWDAYTRAWAMWDGTVETMAWPVEGGRREGINETVVREFFTCGLDLESIGEREFAVKIKEERVRWHPDKIQQRLGGRVSSNVMKDVTAIFQTVDRLWTEMRSQKA